MTEDKPAREFWIADYDCPECGSPPVYEGENNHSSQTKAAHTIEYSAYQKVCEELEVLKLKHEELLSYLPKVPTEPYTKSLIEEIERLKKEINDGK